MILLFITVFTVRRKFSSLLIAGIFFTSWAPREAQEYWSGYSIPSPGDLPDPRIKRGSPALHVVFAYTGMYPLEHILFPCFLFLILNKVLFIPLWQKKTVLNKIGRYHACWLTKRQQTQSNSESNSCCSVAKLCSTLCDPMNLSTPGSPVLHSVSQFAHTHVHWVNDAIQPFHLCCPLLLPSIFPSIMVFSNELALHIRWLKY